MWHPLSALKKSEVSVGPAPPFPWFPLGKADHTGPCGAQGDAGQQRTSRPLCQEAGKRGGVFLHETHFILVFVCFWNEG